MARELASFAVWDYLVFAVVLLVSAGIGVFYGWRGQKTTGEFLMADRQMQILPVALSMLASFMSAIMLLGTPAEIYTFGTQYMVIGIAYIVLMPIAAFLYIPVFYNLRLTSAYEYLEIRFKKKIVRMIGSTAFIMQMILYMAIVLYAPSLALNAVTGFNVWASVFSVGCVCTFYTSLGGMKAVMWTDVFQVSMMIVGLFAVLVKGVIDEGGFARIWHVAEQGDRILFDDFNPDPTVRHTVWSLTFGAVFTWLAIYGVNQSQVQRALTCRKLRHAQIAMLINAPGLIVLLLLTSFCGLIMYSHYRGCDPMMNGDIWASDQMLPLYVMDALGKLHGLPGLFVACLFSGALSTVSSGLNSLAAVTIQDIVRGFFWPNISEERATKLSKLIAFGYGIVMILLTIVAAQLGSVLQAALGLFGMIGGPLLGVFTLGMFFPQANWKGAVAGMLSSLCLMFWIGIGANVITPIHHYPPVSVSECPIDNVTMTANQTRASMTSSAVDAGYSVMANVANATTAPPAGIERSALAQFYALSYLWYSFVAVVCVLVVGLIVTYITGPMKPGEVDPKTISPLFHIACPCLPKRWRHRLSCYIEHEGKYEEKDDIEECKTLQDAAPPGEPEGKLSAQEARANLVPPSSDSKV